MAGATDTHVTIALNLAVLLRSHLRDSSCRVYISDMKAKIEARNCCLDARTCGIEAIASDRLRLGALAPCLCLAPDGERGLRPSVPRGLCPDRGCGSHRFFYPDVMVTCEAQDRENSTFKQFPRLIIEVLSDSTEAFARGDKFADYQLLPSLQEYVLVNTKKARIECFRRTAEGLWLLQFYELEADKFELTSVEFSGKISDVYEQVEFAPEADLIEDEKHKKHKKYK